MTSNDDGIADVRIALKQWAETSPEFDVAAMYRSNRSLFERLAAAPALETDDEETRIWFELAAGLRDALASAAQPLAPALPSEIPNRSVAALKTSMLEDRRLLS